MRYDGWVSRGNLALGWLAIALVSPVRANAAEEPRAGDALRRLRSQSAPTEQALAVFLREAQGSNDELSGRLIVAEAAYRSQNLQLAREALESPELSSRADFLSGYGCFLAGLLDPSAGLAHFSRAYERAGDSLLRHRAALWMAEALRARGDVAGALRLLEVIPEHHLGEAQRADLMVRRLLLLDALARADDARSLAKRIIEEFGAVADQDDIRPLCAIALQHLGGAHELEGPARVARIRSLLATRRFRAAVAEARQLLAVANVDMDEARTLAAEAELLGGSAQRALAAATAVRTSSRHGASARLVQARAWLALGQHRSAEKLLRDLVADAEAGPQRFAAAALLADLVSERSGGEADRLRQLVIAGAEPGEAVDDAAWELGWARYLHGDFAAAVPWFGRLMERTREPVHIARGTYWAGRAKERLGLDDDAARLYRESLGVEPYAYYGLVARLRLTELGGSTSQPPPRERLHPPPLDPLWNGPTNLLIALQPARELLGLGLVEDAIAESQFQARRFPHDPAPSVFLAEALNASGDYQQSVLALRAAFPDLSERGVPQRYWTQLYPLTYWDTIQQAASATTLDPYLVAAVLYQESRFKADARSGAGAIGLMQIMPATGREIARHLGERRHASAKLLEPETNIRYGSFFLRHLLDRLDDSSVLALAAYNAGPGRVARWRNGGPWDEFVESIPFRETRLYVKKILVAHADYHQVYDSELPCSVIH